MVPWPQRQSRTKASDARFVNPSTLVTRAYCKDHCVGGEIHSQSALQPGAAPTKECSTSMPAVSATPDTEAFGVYQDGEVRSTQSGLPPVCANQNSAHEETWVLSCRERLCALARDDVAQLQHILSALESANVSATVLVKTRIGPTLMEKCQESADATLRWRGASLCSRWRDQWREATALTRAHIRKSIETYLSCHMHLADEMYNVMMALHSSAEWAAELCAAPEKSAVVRNCLSVIEFLQDNPSWDCRLRGGLLRVEHLLVHLGFQPPMRDLARRAPVEAADAKQSPCGEQKHAQSGKNLNDMTTPAWEAMDEDEGKLESDVCSSEEFGGESDAESMQTSSGASRMSMCDETTRSWRNGAKQPLHVDSARNFSPTKRGASAKRQRGGYGDGGTPTPCRRRATTPASSCSSASHALTGMGASTGKSRSKDGSKPHAAAASEEAEASSVPTAEPGDSDTPMERLLACCRRLEALEPRSARRRKYVDALIRIVAELEELPVDMKMLQGTRIGRILGERCRPCPRGLRARATALRVRWRRLWQEARQAKKPPRDNSAKQATAAASTPAQQSARAAPAAAPDSGRGGGEARSTPGLGTAGVVRADSTAGVSSGVVPPASKVAGTNGVVRAPPSTGAGGGIGVGGTPAAAKPQAASTPATAKPRVSSTTWPSMAQRSMAASGPAEPSRAKIAKQARPEKDASGGGVSHGGRSNHSRPAGGVGLEAVRSEITRILNVQEGSAQFSIKFATQVLQLPQQQLSGPKAAEAAARAFRNIAKRIHPDGRPSLGDDDELRCHEAMARLQRARSQVQRHIDTAATGGCVEPLPPPMGIRCGLVAGTSPGSRRWWIHWVPLLASAAARLSHYEVRARDGSRFVTVAAVEPHYDAQLGRFVEAVEISRCELQERELRPQLLAGARSDGGRLGLRIAAVGKAGVGTVMSNVFTVSVGL